MLKTKLEIYVDILKILAQKDSIRITFKDAQKLNIRFNELKIYLGFLLKQQLVDKRKLADNQISYLVTQRGLGILKHFGQLEQDHPVSKEIGVS
jgi:predicted transcriptional regulator